jgi:hypothetical protein
VIPSFSKSKERAFYEVTVALPSKDLGYVTVELMRYDRATHQKMIIKKGGLSLWATD